MIKKRHVTSSHHLILMNHSNIRRGIVQISFNEKTNDLLMMIKFPFVYSFFFMRKLTVQRIIGSRKTEMISCRRRRSCSVWWASRSRFRRRSSSTVGRRRRRGSAVQELSAWRERRCALLAPTGAPAPPISSPTNLAF